MTLNHKKHGRADQIIDRATWLSIHRSITEETISDVEVVDGLLHIFTFALAIDVPRDVVDEI